jgi:chitin disaccharide deacetylase
VKARRTTARQMDPCVAPEERLAAAQLLPWIKKVWNAGLPVLDDLFTGFTGWKGEDKRERLMEVLKGLKPGVTEILFHASQPTEEFPLITGSSEARHADLKALTDPRVKKLIQRRGIILTTWKELKERRKKAAPME